MEIKITKNEKETKDFAREFAKSILKEKRSDGAKVVALDGILGAGKTTFVQGFASALGINDITSPTFNILKEYFIDLGEFKRFYHVDCYRLKGGNDIDDVGLSEVLKNPENLILIEWAKNIKDKLPKKIIKVKIHYISENKRKISIN